jgi:hypothetical protein
VYDELPVVFCSTNEAALLLLIAKLLMVAGAQW